MLCILPFGMLRLSATSIIFGNILLAVCNVYVGGYGGLSENDLCVFRELCLVGFLADGESPSVLL